MKKFEIPEVEIEKLEVEDVLTTSNDDAGDNWELPEV
jgi:hypothetical protein